jgi:hypothetical protein
MNKKIAAESLNMMVVNEKMNNMGIQTVDEKPRLMQVVLRSEFVGFPAGVPMIVAVKRTPYGQIMYQLKNSKLAHIADIDIASLTNIKSSFKIGSVMYKLSDTVNGFPRYHAVFGHSRANR